MELREPSELCTSAFKCRQSETFDEIRRRHRDKAPNESGSAWHNICHCIGRLQSWVRAIKFLICFIKEHPRVVKNHETGFVRFSEHPEALGCPDADHKTNLQGVLARMLPNEEERAEKALKLLQDHPKAISQEIDSVYTEMYGEKPFTPRCHAELMILEYFWTKKLPFFDHVPYVGGSKPSCYCCDLYFRSHPSKITTRATHGNVWPKWCLPSGLKQEDGNRLEWDYKIMLKRMTEEIRSDVLTLIESDLPRRKRLPDSTTGVWTTPTLAALLT